MSGPIHLSRVRLRTANAGVLGKHDRPFAESDRAGSGKRRTW
jgi:hypothetical protein